MGPLCPGSGIGVLLVLLQGVKKEMENAGASKNKLKGTKIRTANYLMILAACVLYMFILYGMFRISRQYDDLIRTADEYISSEEITANIAEGSNILTEQARLYAVTAEPEHMEAYFQEANVDRRRELALEELEEFYMDGEVKDYLKKALDRSNELMENEFYSMRLVSEANEFDPQRLPEEIQAVELSKEDAAMNDEAKIQKAQELVLETDTGTPRRRLWKTSPIPCHPC